MTTISFPVNGWPPNIKKNAKSMRRNPTQAERLNALQTKARAARKDRGLQPFTSGIRLRLRVHVGSEFHISGDPDNSGDLDNFIAGVCDGLKEGVAFDDDRHVVKIDAEKIVGSGDHCYYKIELEGE